MKKNNLKTKLTSLLLTLLMLAGTLALSVSAYPTHTDYISDTATILDESTESSIKAASDSLYEARAARVAVCTVLNTEDKTPAEYAASLFTEWQVGNGVLILLVTEADTFYAVQSNSVANVLTGEKLSEILNSTLEPEFAEKEYSAGALSAVNAISTFLSQSLPEDFGKTAEKGGMPTFLKVVLIAVLVIALIIAAGYALLVIAEKKQAERRRLELEARRRMAMEGRSNPQMMRPRTPDSRPYQPQRRPAQPQSRPVQPQSRPAQPRRNVNNAATIQINTADIRAARNAQNRPAPRRRPYTDGDNY